MPRTVRLDTIDVNDTHAVVSELKFSNGDTVQSGDLVAMAETTKAVEEIRAPENGVIWYVIEEGDKIAFGEPLYILAENQSELLKVQEQLEHSPHPSEREEEPPSTLKATKKALAKAKELGIDLHQLPTDHAITSQDVLAFASHQTPQNHQTVFQYDRERVIVIGGGKGSHVVCDILLDDHDKTVVGIVDDHVKKYDFFYFPVVFDNVHQFPHDFDRNAYDTVIISIGANAASMEFRHSLFLKYQTEGLQFTNAIASSAEIRRSISIGVGNVIGSGVYVGTRTRIGNNNLVSYGTMIGHHNQVGDSNLFAPGVHTSGSVEIGNRCLFGASVNVINRCKIGSHSIFPCGYSITSHCDEATVVKFSANT